MKKEDSGQTPFLIFADIVKDIKKKLPKTCSLLTPFRTIKGEIQVKAIIKKTEHRYTVPENLKFTNADIRKLHSSLLEKC